MVEFYPVEAHFSSCYSYQEPPKNWTVLYFAVSKQNDLEQEGFEESEVQVPQGLDNSFCIVWDPGRFI